MIKQQIQQLVSASIQKIWPDFVTRSQAMGGKPINTEFGDYAMNVAFILAKKLSKSPQEVAETIAAKLREALPSEIAKVEAVGGHVNFFLSEDFVRQELARIYRERGSFGKSDIGRGRKIIVEYSQPNIAKPMHIGHLRNTVLGDALANILEFLGYKVIRWNYIGDWGTQFGKLIAAYKLWGTQLRGSASKYLEAEPLSDKKGIKLGDLVDLYVRFHQELKDHPELERRGQEEFRKLEQGDKENLKLWEWFRKESLKEFEKTYKLLDVEFDETIGESFFEKDLEKLVDQLMKDKIAEVGEESAIIIDFARAPLVQGAPLQDLPPALIQKGDGASLYLTRDIAALQYRLKKYKPTKLLYVVGDEQSLHFEQLFAIARILGWQQADPVTHTDVRYGAELQHIKYGLVLGENKKKMSTREGEAIPLTELVKKAVELARKIVEDKNQDISESEKQQIAETVGIGALKYEMLKEHRNSDIVFDWNKMLDLRGNSAPYLQYTYARLAGILRKAGSSKRLSLFKRGSASKPNVWKSNFQTLKEPSELAIIKHLIDFPDIVASTDSTYTTNHIALYLYELANLANQFYETVRVLDDEKRTALQNSQRELRWVNLNARLVLIETTASILKTGLGLLGIGVLEKI